MYVDCSRSGKLQWTSVLKACWWCESAKALAVREGCREQGSLRRQVAARGALVVLGEI
jgi:hypothetical protein